MAGTAWWHRRRLCVPEPNRPKASHEHEAVCPPRGRVGRGNRTSTSGIRDAFAATDQASIIYKATGNLRAVQILLGHTKIENTVRYLGVDVEDAPS